MVLTSSPNAGPERTITVGETEEKQVNINSYTQRAGVGGDGEKRIKYIATESLIQEANISNECLYDHHHTTTASTTHRPPCFEIKL